MKKDNNWVSIYSMQLYKTYIDVFIEHAEGSH